MGRYDDGDDDNNSDDDDNDDNSDEDDDDDDDSDDDDDDNDDHVYIYVFIDTFFFQYIIYSQDHTVVTVDTHTHGGKLCIISTVTFYVSLTLNCAYMLGKNAKYSTGGNHNDETTLKEVEEALIESAKEADRQKLFVEKQSENLKRRLHSVKGELLTCCIVLC